MDTAAVKPPAWFWIVSGLAVAWMLIGTLAWVSELTLNDAARAQMSDVQRQVYAARPAWILAVHAIATLSGLAGAAGLLLRKGWAKSAFIISLVAIIVQFGYILLVMDTVRLLGAGAVLPIPIIIFCIGLFLVWLAGHSKKSGWIA